MLPNSFSSTRNLEEKKYCNEKPKKKRHIISKRSWVCGLGFGVSYAHIVQPVLDKHCAECHNATRTAGGVDLSPDRTDFFNVSYEVLARQGRPGQNPYTKWIPTVKGNKSRDWDCKLLF